MFRSRNAHYFGKRTKWPKSAASLQWRCICNDRKPPESACGGESLRRIHWRYRRSDRNADILNWTLTPHTPMTIGPLHTTAGHTTIFNFGAFNFKSTPEDTISSQGDDLTVTAKLIDPGTPVTFGATKNATCIDYDNTGGSCWEVDVLCSGPDCGGSYDAEFATSYDHAATIVKPGFLKNHSASCPTTMFETNQIDGFFQTRIDPTTKAKSVEPVRAGWQPRIRMVSRIAFLTLSASWIQYRTRRSTW